MSVDQTGCWETLSHCLSCPGTGTGEQGPDSGNQKDPNSRKDGEWLKKCVAHYMYM